MMPEKQTEDGEPSTISVGEGKEKCKLESTEPEDVKIKPPQWFLKNCVVRACDWNNIPVDLALKSNEDTDLESKATTLTSGTTTYEMDATLFAPFKKLIKTRLADSNTEAGLDDQHDSSYFVDKIIRAALYTEGLAITGDSFLLAVVKHCARLLGSNLITLTPDDRVDLLEHITQLKEPDLPHPEPPTLNLAQLPPVVPSVHFARQCGSHPSPPPANSQLHTSQGTNTPQNKNVNNIPTHLILDHGC